MADRREVASLAVNLLEGGSSIEGHLQVYCHATDLVKNPFYIEVKFRGYLKISPHQRVEVTRQYNISNREGAFSHLNGDVFKVNVPTNPNTDQYQVLDIISDQGRYNLLRFRQAFRAKVLTNRWLIWFYTKSLHHVVYHSRCPHGRKKAWPHLKTKINQLLIEPMAQVMMLITEEFYRHPCHNNLVGLGDYIKKWWENNKLDPMPHPIPRYNDFFDCIKPNENLFDYRKGKY